MRTALSQFSFALVVTRIFNAEFYSIGALFAVYGGAVMLVAVYRRYEGNRQFFEQEEETDSSDSDGNPHTHTVLRKKFRTSGNTVALLMALSLGAYVTLLVLLCRL
jgi:hypothetical protein